MHYLPILLQIAVVYLVAIATPGPNFFLITQMSLAGRRGLGAVSALGVSTGSMMWATLAMLGVSALLQRVEWLYAGIRVGGAVYIVYFGIKLLRASTRPNAMSVDAPAPETMPHDAAAYVRAYRTGLLTSATNPKSCAFWTSVFAAMFPTHPPLWFCGAVLALIGLLACGWYGGVALMFATERTQRGYRRLRRPIDALCGTALVGFGTKLFAVR